MTLAVGVLTALSFITPVKAYTGTSYFDEIKLIYTDFDWTSAEDELDILCSNYIENNKITINVHSNIQILDKSYNISKLELDTYDHLIPWELSYYDTVLDDHDITDMNLTHVYFQPMRTAPTGETYVEYGQPIEIRHLPVTTQFQDTDIYLDTQIYKIILKYEAGFANLSVLEYYTDSDKIDVETNIAFYGFPTREEDINQAWMSGYISGERDTHKAYETIVEDAQEYGRLQGIEQGKTEGYNEAWNEIDSEMPAYIAGYNVGISETVDTTWIGSMVAGFGEIIEIEILPNVSIGWLLFMPFLFPFLRWFLKSLGS